MSGRLARILASAIGGPTADPMTFATDCRWDDILLLCTDGLTRHVSDEEIEAELRGIESAEASSPVVKSLPNRSDPRLTRARSSSVRRPTRKRRESLKEVKSRPVYAWSEIRV